MKNQISEYIVTVKIYFVCVVTNSNNSKSITPFVNERFAIKLKYTACTQNEQSHRWKTFKIFVINIEFINGEEWVGVINYWFLGTIYIQLLTLVHTSGSMK